MRRSPSILLAAAAVLVAVACSDTLEPKRASLAVATPAPALARGASWGPSVTLTEQAGRASVGLFTLRWSDDAIACVGNPCVPYTGGPVRLSVQIKSANGFHWVDFSPHVEFKDGSSVVLETAAHRGLIQRLARAGFAPTDPIWRTFAIRYAPAIGDAGVIDAPTTIDFRTGTISRPISHFSGYVITSGFVCDPITAGDGGCGGGGGTTDSVPSVH